MTVGAVGVVPVGMSRDVAEQVLRMSREPRMTRRVFDRSVAESLRFVGPVEQQRGAAQYVVAPAESADVTSRRLTLEARLCFPDAAQRLTGLVELRQAQPYNATK